MSKLISMPLGTRLLIVVGALSGMLMSFDMASGPDE